MGRHLPADSITGLPHSCGPLCRDGAHALLTYSADAAPHVLAEARRIYTACEVLACYLAPEAPPAASTALYRKNRAWGLHNRALHAPGATRGYFLVIRMHTDAGREEGASDDAHR